MDVGISQNQSVFLSPYIIQVEDHKIQSYIEMGSDVNKQSFAELFKETLSMIDSNESIDREIFEINLKRLSDINAVWISGSDSELKKSYTLLQKAIKMGKEDCVQLLLKSGASPDVVNLKELSARDLTLKKKYANFSGLFSRIPKLEGLQLTEFPCRMLFRANVESDYKVFNAVPENEYVIGNIKLNATLLMLIDSCYQDVLNVSIKAQLIKTENSFSYAFSLIDSNDLPFGILMNIDKIREYTINCLSFGSADDLNLMHIYRFDEKVNPKPMDFHLMFSYHYLHEDQLLAKGNV